MGQIRLLQIDKCEHIVQYKYVVSDDLKKYFILDNPIFVKYDEGIGDVPDSLLAVPFVVNVLPIAWLTDSTIIVNEIDSVFYSSIDKIKSGYANMHPGFRFNGKVEANSIVEKSIPGENSATGVMFSGGLDAFSTLIAHYEENPHLITIGGADVALNDTKGWNLIKQQTLDATKEFGLPKPFFIESNFRYFLNERELDLLVVDSKDGWWHGFQHGIGLLGLTAPIAHLYNINLIYIASSFWQGVRMTCASDPTIDNNLAFGSTSISHDQYDCSRQKKIKLLSEFWQNNKKEMFLRVCWKSHEGNNCCRCEKCYRTIVGLLAEGLDPEQFGFKGYKEHIGGAKRLVNGFMKESPVLRICWADVKNRYEELQIYKEDKNLNWIYNLRFDQNYSKFYYQMRNFYRSFRSFGGKILRVCHLK